MRRAQDRARSARSRKNGARSATFKNSGARSATIEYYGARSATIESRALGALKLASCARSARWECAREADRFFSILFRYILWINSSLFLSIPIFIFQCSMQLVKLEISFISVFYQFFQVNPIFFQISAYLLCWTQKDIHFWIEYGDFSFVSMIILKYINTLFLFR